MHQILKSHSGALGTVCSGLMSWGGPWCEGCGAQLGTPSPTAVLTPNCSFPVRVARWKITIQWNLQCAANEHSQIVFLPPTCNSLPRDKFTQTHVTLAEALPFVWATQRQNM